MNTDLYKHRKQAEAAEVRSSKLYRERQEADSEKYRHERAVYEMPCDTVGWTDEELARHIYHMHDSVGYVHVGNGMPRKIIEAIHDLVKGYKRIERHSYGDNE